MKLSASFAFFSLGFLLPVLSYPSQVSRAVRPHQFEVLVPESAGVGLQDQGHRSHTHLRVLVVPDASSAEAASQFNTPASIRNIYNLPANGGSQAIAVVDAYHYPTALSDLRNFSQVFSLPRETSHSSTSVTNTRFQVVYATGVRPASGGNYIASWNLEAALDMEWAHAMSPNAKIYLVEAASDSTNDLFYAVQVAAGLPGVREVSMSWGGSEFASETFFDTFFLHSGVVYFASGGDDSEISYPACSPNVVSCGGTTINRDFNGGFVGETAWMDTGCGPSLFETLPVYQNSISSILGNQRGSNDISFDADPNTGVYVYDSTPLWGQRGWWALGGTSVSSPSLAGVINLAATAGNGFAPNTFSEQSRLYSHLGDGSIFRDITQGLDGEFSSTKGWDFITGLGTPVGLTGK